MLLKSGKRIDRALLTDRDSNRCQLSRVISFEFSTKSSDSRQSRSRLGANSNGERGERHCRRTVSCALGAPVKTIVSTQLTHDWLVGSGRCWPVEGTLQAATNRAHSRDATAVAGPRLRCRSTSSSASLSQCIPHLKVFFDSAKHTAEICKKHIGDATYALRSMWSFISPSFSRSRKTTLIFAGPVRDPSCGMMKQCIAQSFCGLRF